MLRLETLWLHPLPDGQVYQAHHQAVGSSEAKHTGVMWSQKRSECDAPPPAVRLCLIRAWGAPPWVLQQVPPNSAQFPPVVAQLPRPPTPNCVGRQERRASGAAGPRARRGWSARSGAAPGAPATSLRLWLHSLPATQHRTTSYLGAPEVFDSPKDPLHSPTEPLLADDTTIRGPSLCQLGAVEHVVPLQPI